MVGDYGFGNLGVRVVFYYFLGSTADTGSTLDERENLSISLPGSNRL